MIPLFIGIIQHNKKLPSHISFEGPTYKTDELEFLYDLTYQKNEERVLEQQLLGTALEIINEAENFLVVDMFLYNDDYDRDKGEYPNSAQKITNALVEKRKDNPTMSITVLTDAVNTLYGSTNNPYFETLEDNNINVLITNVKPLRDSNPIYSSIWRPYLQWWQPSQEGFLPNAFNPDGRKGSIGSYLDLINFKANHRKIILNESRAMLTSANLTHDGSSYHSNIGFVVQGDILKDIYQSEQAVANMTGYTLPDVTFKSSNETNGALEIQLVTEGKIKKALLGALAEADEQSTIKIGVFYISDRQIVKGIKEAAKRGANVQMILDPNKDAFGIEKNGIPNRQVAAELVPNKNIEVRFYDTNGEQFHSKFVIVTDEDETTLIGGSANFTRRNLADYNLESNLVINMPKTHVLTKEINDYFDRMWNNDDGQFTVEFEKYEDQTLWKKAFYRLQEFTGLSTF